MIITKPSGTTKIYLGKSAPAPTGEPAWATSLLTSNDRWFGLPHTNYKSFHQANIPAGAYIGNDPFAAPVNAYCDPATVLTSSAAYQYFYGAGHGDGTINSVVRFNWETLQYSVTALPTPPSKYPPKYGVDRLLWGGTATQPGPLEYPNGATPGYFDPNPIHGAYSAPALARPSSHMYDTAVHAQGKIYYFYANPARFNIAGGVWEAVNHVDYGAQLNAISTSFTAGGFNTQSAAKYDSVTDKFWVTVVPGDGNGYRWHMARIDRATETIEAVISVGTDLIGNGSTLVQVGRWLYSFKATRATYSAPVTYNTGFRILMDAPYTVEAIACSGVQAPARSTGAGFEVMPSTYDPISNRIVRCDYTSNSNTIFEINPTPVSGAGTLGDPRLLTQTARTLSNSLTASALYPYSRAFFYPGTRILCLIPQADSNAQAVRLS